MKLLRKFIITLGLASLLSMNVHSTPIEVDLQLVLAVDVSGSVNNSRYLAQKMGYVNAFNNPLVHNAIAAGMLGSIAVTYMEWSGSAQQSQQVGWTQISSASDAEAFANSIAATTRAFNGLTGIAAAMDWSVDSILQNDFESFRKVIDISGDGEENACSPALSCLANSRDAAVAAGVTVNGLAIEEVTGINLTDYYADNVIGGAGSFVLTAATFEDFEAAILQKLQAEIGGTDPNPVPAPATLALFTLSLGILFGFRRRQLR